MKLDWETFRRALLITCRIILILSCISIGVIMFIFAGDALTLEEIGTKRVKCIDDVGAEFEDEWCEKDISCSKIGWASGGVKCKE